MKYIITISDHFDPSRYAKQVSVILTPENGRMEKIGGLIELEMDGRHINIVQFKMSDFYKKLIKASINPDTLIKAVQCRSLYVVTEAPEKHKDIREIDPDLAMKIGNTDWKNCNSDQLHRIDAIIREK